MHIIVTREDRLYFLLSMVPELRRTTYLQTVHKAVPITELAAAFRTHPRDLKDRMLHFRYFRFIVELVQATPYTPTGLVMREPQSTGHITGSNYAVQVYKFGRFAAY